LKTSSMNNILPKPRSTINIFAIFDFSFFPTYSSLYIYLAALEPFKSKL
jgi:hypothetical protein